MSWHEHFQSHGLSKMGGDIILFDLIQKFLHSIPYFIPKGYYTAHYTIYNKIKVNNYNKEAR